MLRTNACVAALLFLTAAGTPADEERTPISALPFSAARQAGDLLFVSGQIARTPEGADVKDSVAAETRQVMDNIGRVLEENGYAFDDVVFVNVYLKDISDYKEMNRVYATFFAERFPARACTGGNQIVFDFRVEISCVACKEAE